MKHDTTECRRRVSRNLIKLLAARDLNAFEVSKMGVVSHGTIYRMLNATHDVGLSTAYALATTLGCSVDDFLKD